MKGLKVFFIIFLTLVLIAGVAIFIFLKTLDINQYKSQITQEMGKSLGREVRIDRASFDFSVIKGVVLNINGLSVSDHRDFSLENIVTVDSVLLDVHVLTLLTKRKVLISKIELEGPHINFVRNKDGKTNFQNLVHQIQEIKSNSSSPEKTLNENLKGFSSLETVIPQTEEQGQDVMLPQMLIKSIKVTDGSFSFVDRTFDPALTVPITKLDLHAPNVSLNKVLTFRASCSLWGYQKNIYINGLAQIDENNAQIRFSDLTLKTDLSDLSVRRIIDTIPAFNTAGLETDMEGQIFLVIRQMIVGKEGLLVLSLDGHLTDGEVKLESIPDPVENIELRFEMTESEVNIKELSMEIASGTVDVYGRINEYLNEKRLWLNLSLSDIRLDELIARKRLPIIDRRPVKILGKIYGSFEGTGEGLNLEMIEESFSGEGNLEMREGRLVDLNIMHYVLNEILGVPSLMGEVVLGVNLVDKIKENLPEQYRDRLRQKDTIIGKVKLDARVRDGTLFINRADAETDGILFTANGKLDIDLTSFPSQNLQLDGAIYFRQDLSQSLVSSVEELSSLLNEQNQLRISLKPYTGELARFKMSPDAADLRKRIVEYKGKEELRKVIFKALDLEDLSTVDSGQREGQVISRPPADDSSQAQDTEGQRSDGSQEKQEVSPEQVIIENILDAIF